MPRQQGSKTRSVEVGNGIFADYRAMNKAKSQGPVRNTFDAVKRHPVRSIAKGTAVAVGVTAAYKLVVKAGSSTINLLIDNVKNVTDRAGRSSNG